VSLDPDCFGTSKTLRGIHATRGVAAALPVLGTAVAPEMTPFSLLPYQILHFLVESLRCVRFDAAVWRLWQV
jgi:hypothetical protein